MELSCLAFLPPVPTYASPPSPLSLLNSSIFSPPYVIKRGA